MQTGTHAPSDFLGAMRFAAQVGLSFGDGEIAASMPDNSVCRH
jgi:hypothetical protein